MSVAEGESAAEMGETSMVPINVSTVQEDTELLVLTKAGTIIHFDNYNDDLQKSWGVRASTVKNMAVDEPNQVSTELISVIKYRLSIKATGIILFTVLLLIFLINGKDQLMAFPGFAFSFFVFYLVVLFVDMVVASYFSRQLTEANFRRFIAVFKVLTLLSAVALIWGLLVITSSGVFDADLSEAEGVQLRSFIPIMIIFKVVYLGVVLFLVIRHNQDKGKVGDSG